MRSPIAGVTLAACALTALHCSSTDPTFVGDVGGGGNIAVGNGGAGATGGAGDGAGGTMTSGPGGSGGSGGQGGSAPPIDSDGDGFDDAVELECLTDPMDELSFPQPDTITGAGTAMDPYRICLADHLFLLGQDAMYMGAELRMGADLDQSDATITPLIIGSATSPFVGVFDGRGHSITNRTIPMFQTVGAGGLVKDLRVIGTGTLFDAGIAANNDGRIENTHFTGDVLGGPSSGGFVNQNDGQIYGCSVGGTLEAFNHVGGLAGGNGQMGTIERSWSTSTITAGNRVGGLVGSNYGQIEECYATSTITGDTFVGGLVGTMWDGEIRNSFVHCGSITVTNIGGGLVGSVDAATSTFLSYTYVVCPVTGPTADALIGEATSSVYDTYTYFDNSQTAVSAFGAGYTPAQLQDPTTFVNWDFNTPIWKFDAAISAFPVLAYQTQGL